MDIDDQQGEPTPRPHVNETSTGGYLPRIPLPPVDWDEEEK